MRVSAGFAPDFPRHHAFGWSAQLVTRAAGVNQPFGVPRLARTRRAAPTHNRSPARTTPRRRRVRRPRPHRARGASGCRARPARRPGRTPQRGHRRDGLDRRARRHLQRRAGPALRYRADQEIGVQDVVVVGERVGRDRLLARATRFPPTWRPAAPPAAQRMGNRDHVAGRHARTSYLMVSPGPRCREAGANPARSRHCDRGARDRDDVGRGSRGRAVIRESDTGRGCPCSPRGWSAHMSVSPRHSPGSRHRRPPR